MTFDATTTTISMAVAGAIALIAYVALILVPAVGSYGRVWERIAAGFLTLFMLAALTGVGAVIGLAVVWSYDRYA